MNVVEVCAGIGGFSLAAEWMNWQVVGHVEIDPFCSKVLKHHWPDAWHHDDIRTLDDLTLANLMYPGLDDMKLGRKRKNYGAAVEMYEAGFSVGETASYFGMSRQAMWSILTIRGVEMRPQQKYGEENHFYRGGQSWDGVTHNLTETAVQRGILVRPDTCSQCSGSGTFTNGRSSIQAHHDDYNKPLGVRWLCQPCHHEWHKHNVPIRKEVMPHESQADAIDLVCGGIP